MREQWGPEQRQRFLANLEAEDLRRRTVQPELTGDRLHDLAAFDDAVDAAERYWDELDGDYKSALNALGPYSSGADRLEVQRLRTLTDAAWADRQNAIRTRDALLAPDRFNPDWRGER